MMGGGAGGGKVNVNDIHGHKIRRPFATHDLIKPLLLG